MWTLDEDALVCDFAETYHMDLRSLPLRTAATLAQGLSENSRIMRRLSGATISTETALLAMACDRLGLIAWMLSEDGHRGQNRPASILELLAKPKDAEEPLGFDTGDNFAAAWAALTGGDA